MTEEEQKFENQIFPWNANFEVGVAEIDAQHQKLVQLINEICSTALNNEDHGNAIEKLFAKLIDYTKYHFDFEEDLYKNEGLPEVFLQTHIETHSGFVSQVTGLKAKYDSHENEAESLDEILTTLVLWLTDHILNEDLRMCLIVTRLGDGIDAEIVEDVVRKEMESNQSNITKVMVAMTNVSNASFKELRREIAFRRQLEIQLKEEISTRKEAQEKLKHLAQHDALTGLPNRLLFEELCSLGLKNAKRNTQEQAVLFADIDGFKAVNDTLGHKAGDALLISIAERLRDCVRNSDVVARIGGDEFVVYLGGTCGDEDSKNIASKIVNSISTSFNLPEGVAKVGASIGIAVFPKDSDTTQGLLKKADDAMYVAKKSGKNAYKMFSELSH